MKRIAGRVALVTGASRGLGEAIARRLASAGARVALAARTADALESLAAELRAAGADAAAFEADVTDTASCERLVERVTRELGPIAILVNNAGIERTGRFEALTFDEDREVVDVNLLGGLRLAHAVVPGMLAAGCGHVVWMSSVAGFVGLPNGLSYAATKAALLAASASLRMEYRGRGVSASAVVPGFVHGAGMYEAQKVATGGRPSPRLLGSTTPERVADAVLGAIVRDRPEVVVNSVPLRLSFALARLFPRLGQWMVLRSSGAYTATLAEARLRKG